MALTAAQYRDKAEYWADAAGDVVPVGGLSKQPDSAAARAQIASIYAYLYVEQARIDAAASA